MSTINKILKPTAGICFWFTPLASLSATGEALTIQNYTYHFLKNFVYSTIPGTIAGVIGHSHYRGKIMEYFPIAMYGSAMMFVSQCHKANNLKYANKIKMFMVSGIISSLAANVFLEEEYAKKYAKINSETTPELDPITDSDLNLDALKVSTDFVSL